MQIILLKDIKGLGRAGNIVSASDGYARNYLIRYKFGEIATPGRLKLLTDKTEADKKTMAGRLKQAEELVKKLNSQTFEIALPADSAGHLYSGLKAGEILGKIKAGANASRIELALVDYQPLKRAGPHRVKLAIEREFHAETTVLIKPKQT